MIKGRGWFVYYFSGLCEGKSLAEVESSVYRACDGEPVYDGKNFVDVLGTLLWSGFGGAIHPVLGRIEICSEIPPGRPDVTKWEIACQLGKAEFETR